MRAGWLLPLALAACADEPEPANTSVPLEGPPPLAAPPDRLGTQDATGRDAVSTERGAIPEIAGVAVAAGRWRFIEDSEARFGSVFSIRCDRDAGMIVLTRAGVGGSAMQVLADRGANRFDAQAEGGRTVARFAASFPWFADVLAKADGNFGVRVDDGQPLVLPTDASIATVVERCR